MPFVINALPELAVILGLAGAFLLHGVAALALGARRNTARRD